MDFSKAGAIERAGNAFRAHVQFYDKGANRNIYGPNRKDKEAAQHDLESMRAAAVTGGPPLQAPIAMYPFGGFAETPLSSCPYDEFPLSPLPCGPKALVDVPFLSAGGNFLKIFGRAKNAPRATF